MTIEKARLFAVADVHHSILGLDLFDKIGVCITQQPLIENKVNYVSNQCPIKKAVVEEFPGLTIFIEKSRFHEIYGVYHQKGQTVPIYFKPKFKIVLKHLLKEGHIEKFSSCLGQNFVSSIVITVEKD